MVEGGAVLQYFHVTAGALAVPVLQKKTPEQGCQHHRVQWSWWSVSLVARMQTEGSAGPDAPRKEKLALRPGFRFSFILRRTLWWAFGG